MTTKKINYIEAAKRFEEFHNEVEIVECTFISWTKKAKFFDKIIQDYFESIPKDVFKNKSVHPRRRKEKKINTFFSKRTKKEKKSKVTTEEIVQKRKQTCIEKYGTDNPSKVDWIKKKKEKTSIENWGTKQPLAASQVRQKIKETNLEKYGSTTPAGNISIQKKMEETNLKKYGVSYFSQTEKFKQEQSKLVIVENENEIPLKDWLEQTKYKNTLPSQVTINQWFVSVEKINEKQLIEKLNQFNSYKTYLEHFIEKELGLKHFNKKPLEIDKLYRPDFKINDSVYVNIDGLYWHKEDYRDKTYHSDLRKEFETHNLRLLQFRENELQSKLDIVKSIINNASGLILKKIYGRNTKITDVSNKLAISFLNENHLKGMKNAKHIGLRDQEGNLISILSWKTHNNVCKIERFCSLKNTIVIGGLSKLLSELEKRLFGKVDEYHYWVDLRYGTGNQLKSFGYELSHETIGFDWTDGKNCFNRLYCTASETNSEKEEAVKKNLYKIYDAGQRLWVKKCQA